MIKGNLAPCIDCGTPLNGSTSTKKTCEKCAEIRYGNYQKYSWIKISKKIRKRDNNTCQSCGRKKGVFDKQLDVHHIIAAKLFDTFEESCHNANLITLCTICHPKVEKGEISCPPIGGWVDLDIQLPSIKLNLDNLDLD